MPMGCVSAPPLSDLQAGHLKSAGIKQLSTKSDHIQPLHIPAADPDVYQAGALVSGLASVSSMIIHTDPSLSWNSFTDVSLNSE